MRNRPPAFLRSRGQTLVLFAIGVFLLALMVMLSLGITTRIKERMELQTVADAAAYSNAVATARSLNAMALMNRAIIGQLVATAGSQAVLSWTAVYIVALKAQRNAFQILQLEYGLYALALAASLVPPIQLTAACAGWVSGPLLTLITGRLATAILWAETAYRIAEPVTLAQMWQRGAGSLYLYTEQQDMYSESLIGAKLNEQRLANRIAQEAGAGSRWTGELRAPPEADEVSRDEINGGISCCLQSIAIPYHMADAAMGSLGWPFVSNRSDPADIMQLKLRKNVRLFVWEGAIPPLEIPPLPGTTWQPMMGVSGLLADRWNLPSEGGTYWAINEHPNWFTPNVPAQLHSDDLHWFFNSVAFVQAAYTASGGPTLCPPPVPTAPVAWARSNISGYSPVMGPLSRHTVVGNLGAIPIGSSEFGLPGFLHAALPPALPTPYAFPWFYDYAIFGALGDPAGFLDNNYGQPKNIAVVERNYSLRSGIGNGDPWAIPYFYQQGASAGQQLDVSGVQLVDGTNISRQTAIATGIAYYHRRADNPMNNHWKEPPNLLNPYWRATLVPANTDETNARSMQDAERAVRAVGSDPGANAKADAIQALRAVGFKGVH